MTEHEALRTTVASIDWDSRNGLLEVRGKDATKFLNRELPGRIDSLQPSIAALVPFLDEAARLIDLLMVVNMRGIYWVVGKRSSIIYLNGMDTSGLETSLHDISGAWSVTGIEGPYSWRSAAEVVGRSVAGLRPLHMMTFSSESLGRGHCLRFGTSGEYGYRIFLPRDNSASLFQEIPKLNDDDFALSSFESGVPTIGATVQRGDCPFEVGLRHMLDFRRDDYRFCQALAAARSKVGRIAVAFRSTIAVDEPMALTMADVLIDGRVHGTVRGARYSPSVGAVIGYAAIDSSFAYPGIRGVSAGGLVVDTISYPPFLSTKSRLVIVE